MHVRVRELAEIVGGEIVGEDRAAVVTSFTIDSRILEPGACFVALEGERDGHDFVADAFAAGATVALVRRAIDLPGPQVSSPQVVVPDPLAALGRLGAAARRRLDATVVGITGSVAKTTTKDLVVAAVTGTRRVHASPASYNNESGVPLTLLSAPDDVEVVVCEMGARRAGDLTALSRIAQPEVGAITSIELAHSGPLGGHAGILRAKGELVEHLPPSGTAVLNADIPELDALVVRTSARVLTVGRRDGDVVYRDVRLDPRLLPTFELVTPWGTREVSLPLRGAHQVSNAAMAASIALALEVPLDAVVRGLATVRTAPRRMELHHTSRGVALIDDTYNANPASVAAALRALAELGADRRIAVLGEMLELGQEHASAHRTLGRLASDLGIDVVVVVGHGAGSIAEGVTAATRVVSAADRDAAARFVVAESRSGDAILVKASRAVGLETVVTCMLEAPA